MKHLLMIACLLTTVLMGTVAFADGTFTTFEEPGGSFFPGVAYLSHDGTAMVGTFFNRFYWTIDDGFIDFDPDGMLNGHGRISEDGMTIAVSYSNADGLDAAGIWNVVTGFSLLDEIPDAAPCGSSLSTSYDVNFGGNVGVGLAWVGCDAVAFKWTAGSGAVNLGSSGNSSRATGVSADGTTTVGFDEHPVSGYRRSAIWTDGVVGPQLILGEDVQGECYDASSDGSKICGVAIADGAFVQTAFYWDTDVGYVDLGFLPGDEADGSIAVDISDDGKVVGYSGNPFFGAPRATIWTPEDGLMPLTDFVELNGVVGYEGQALYSASSISADGSTIVGSYVREGFPPYGLFMIRLNGIVSNEDVEEEIVAPDETPQVATSLLGAYPNPFNPMTTIKFSLQRDQHVRLSVVDMNGARVAVLADGAYSAGTHPINWNGRNLAGREVASGTYLIHMETEEGLQTSKMMLVR